MDEKKNIRISLQENIEDYKKEAIFKGKLGKCANKLYEGVRYLDSALENCEDQDLRHRLEKIRNVLGQDISMGYSFKETEPVTILNKLEEIRRTEVDI